MSSPFRKTAMDRLAGVDKTDDYVRGVHAGRWMIVLVVVLLALAGFSMLLYGIIHAAELSEAVQSSSAQALFELFTE